ncbi:MAG: hypothetical protein RBU21_04810, partial [FCB group bacterium]|nr:hypothetical protein [FCB group bacterium]
ERSIVTAWLNSRQRLAGQPKLENTPELAGSPGEAQDLFAGLTKVDSAPQDYTLIGVALGVIGAGCILAGLNWRIGQLAAGIYWGGMICVFLGALLAMVGLVIRMMARGAKRTEEGNLA